MSLGETIRALRTKKEISLRALAKLAGDVSPAFMSDIELGRRHPSDAVLQDIAAALGTNVDELRKSDTRLPVAALKELASSDPAFGDALRQIVSKGIPGEELMSFVQSHRSTKRRPKK